MSELLTKNEIIGCAFEPKMTSRFIVKMIGKDGKDILQSFVVKSCDRPSVYRENGKWVWNPIKIIAYDPVIPSSAQSLFLYTENDCQEFDMTIEVLGPVGDAVEKWVFTDAQINAIDFGNLDWSTSDMDKKSEIHHLNMVQRVKGGDVLEIAATITYKSVVLEF